MCKKIVTCDVYTLHDFSVSQPCIRACAGGGGGAVTAPVAKETTSEGWGRSTWGGGDKGGGSSVRMEAWQSDDNVPLKVHTHFRDPF